MIVRRATHDDALDVLAWRNDPTTRAMSRDTRVIEEAEHAAWFERALGDPLRLLLIGEDGADKVGMVRIDRGETSEISININPRLRGQGRGATLLAKALACFDGPLLAEVKHGNVASKRLFAKAGFVLIGDQDGMLRYRRDVVSNAASKLRDAPRSIRIAGRRIGLGEPPFIIAELSGNHNGDIGRALKMVDAAKAAGADAIKLQTYTADTLTIDHGGPGFVIESGLWKGRRLYELYQEAATPWDWHPRLFERAAELGVIIFSTPFDASAVSFLQRLRAPAYKIASFELVDLPLIECVARTGKPMIMSTGLASPEEIGEAVAAARAGGAEDLILLHCTSGYPTPAREMHLRTMGDLAAAHGVAVGLSDHTLGSAVSVAAVALGATVIEKHFTLARADGGPDAAFSLEPEEFKRLVDDCRTAWEALGDVHYAEVESERAQRDLRRSLYVVADIAKGAPVTKENVRSIRPGFGLPPKHLPEVLGQVATRDLPRGTPLDWSMLERGG
ncbi:MAG TPA: pseudaminic acid synthase [Caulobacteraceae bacterium]|nr:pseudaminic acid synthase [Caulobacteraceae bacterium]